MIASMTGQARRSPAKPAANPLVGRLHQHGQAPWLDFLARKFIADGSLKSLIDRDGVTGVTSNPSIFEKAIGGSDDYGAALKSALKQGDRDVMSLYEALAIADIRSAADALLPVYKATKGLDGYVSLEVSLSRYGHRRDGGGGAAPVARSFVRQSDDQRARDRRGPADDPPPDRRRHQRQYHTAVFAGGL